MVQVHPLAQSLTLSYVMARHHFFSFPKVGQDHRYYPSFYYFNRDQSRYPKRSGTTNNVHSLRVLDQDYASNQPCDVRSGKNSPEAYILFLMRENIYEEMSYVNRVVLDYTIEHQKVRV